MQDVLFNENGIKVYVEDGMVITEDAHGETLAMGVAFQSNIDHQIEVARELAR